MRIYTTLAILATLLLLKLDVTSGSCSMQDCAIGQHCQGTCKTCAGNPDCNKLPVRKKCLSGTCVQCSSNTECSNSGGTCLFINGVAPYLCGSACTTSSECPTSRPQCIVPDTGVGMQKYCVACELDSECATWLGDPLYGCDSPTCTLKCTTGADCTDSNKPICSSGYCVQCTAHGDCGLITAAKCASKVCVPCGGDAECGHFPATPKCNTTSNTCVQCKGNAECGGATPKCNKILGSCVQCLADNDCSGGTPKCQLSSNTCVKCLADNHCGGSTSKCLTSTGTCVKCVSDTDCTSPSAPKCSSNTCVACSSDTDCHFPVTSKCYSSTLCVQCLDNSHCASPTPNCLTSTGTCVECLDDSDCTSVSAPKCSSTTHTCVPCGSDTDCHFPITTKCSPTAHICLQCLSNNHCTNPSESKCSAGTCVPCSGDQDCNQFSTTKRCLVDLTNTCVQCLSNADCDASVGKFCDLTSHTCTQIPCGTVMDCLGTTPTFPQCFGGVCMKCTSSIQCQTHNASFPVCQSTTGDCLQSVPVCTTNTDCTDPALAACIGTNCQPCSSDNHCSLRATPGFPAYCNSSSGVCQECLSDNDCNSITAALCSFGNCVPCLGPSDCQHLGYDFCYNGGCVHCISNADCASSVTASRCDSAGGTYTCKKCLTDGDCSLLAPNLLCDSNAGCVRCKTDSDCTDALGGLCSPQHTCSYCPISSCASCINNNTLCQTCQNGYFLTNNGLQCVTDCPDGYWENTQTKACDVCSVTCKTCQSAADHCTSCFAPYVLDNSECKTKSDPPTAVLKSTSNPEVYLLVFSNVMNITGDISQYLSFSITNLNSPVDYVLNKTEKQSSGKTFKLTFTFHKSVGTETLTVFFENKSHIVDSASVIIDVDSVSTQTIPFIYFTPTELATAQAMASIGTAVSSAALGSSASMFALGGSGGLLFSFLSLFQIVNYLLYLNVNYPFNVIAFFKIFSVASINSMVPNPIQYVAPDFYEEMQTGLSSPPKFSENDMDGLFLNNAGSTVAGWLAIGLLYLVTKTLLFIFRTSGKLNNLLIWYKNKFEWGLVHNSIMGSYADLLIAVALQLNNMNFQTNTNTLSSILALITGALCFWAPFAVTSANESTSYNFGSKAHQSKHGAIYQDFNTEQDQGTSPETAYFRRNFMAFIFLRKIAHFVGIVLAYDIPVLQMIITSCSGLFLLIFMIWIKPYAQKRDAWLNVGSEVILVLIHLTIFVFAGDDITLKMSDEQRKNVGWVVVGLCSLLVAYNAYFIVVQQITSIWEFIKYVRQVLKKKKVIGDTKQEQTAQIHSQSPRSNKITTRKHRHPANEFPSMSEEVSNVGTNVYLARKERHFQGTVINKRASKRRTIAITKVHA